MGKKKSIIIIMFILGLAVISLGGYSIYHYGQAAPVLHNKESADGSSSLAQQTNPTPIPSASTLQVATSTPQQDNTSASPAPGSAGQSQPTSDAAQSNTESTNRVNTVSPQSSTPALQTEPETGDVQDVVGGLLNGVSVNLQL